MHLRTYLRTLTQARINASFHAGITSVPIKCELFQLFLLSQPVQGGFLFVYLFILKTSVAAVCWNSPTSLSNASNHTAVPLIYLSWPWLCIAVSLRCAVTALLIIIKPIWATGCRWSYNLITKWHLGVSRSQSYMGWLPSVTQAMMTLEGVLETCLNLVVKASCGGTFCQTCVGATQSGAVWQSRTSHTDLKFSCENMRRSSEMFWCC